MGDRWFERPQKGSLWQGIVVVGSDDIPITGVEVAECAGRSVDAGLLPGLVIEYSIGQITGADADILKTNGPASTLIEVALVIDSDFWVMTELPGNFRVHETSQVFSRIADLQGGAMDFVIITGMHLVYVAIGSELRRNVVDGFECLGVDIVPEHSRPIRQIELGRKARAKIPRIAAVAVEFAAGWKQRADFSDRVSRFVVLEERGAGTAVAAVKS